MDAAEQGRSSFVRDALRYVLSHPFQGLLYGVAVLCLVTRIITGLQFRSTIRKQRASNGTHPVPVIPYWIPFIGHAFSFGFFTNDFLRSVADNLGAHSAIYGLMMGNTRHNVVVSPSIARQILVDRNTPITMEPIILRTMNTLWDDKNTVREMDPTVTFGPIHSALTGMMRDPFINTAIPNVVSYLETRLTNLISGTVSIVDHAPWERAGAVSIVQQANPTTNKPFIAEASLHPLMRDFVGDIVMNVIMGRNFMENYPDILHDLWTMDSKFGPFLLGVPAWFPGMVPAARARECIVNAVIEHHDALYRYLNGQDPGNKWGDMSDVSTVMIDRTKAWIEGGAPPRAYGCGDGAIIWATNINANQVIFWVIWYVFSTPSLLKELRDEIAPYIKVQQQEANGTLPIQEAPKVAIDMDSLWKKCPLLKGTIFETMRIEAASMSYKVAEHDFVVAESVDDANMLGKTEPESFYIKKGDYICIPHLLHQSDGRYFRDPDRFDPRRFWTHDTDEKASHPGKADGADGSEKDVKVEYKTMKVWGGGKQLCKGKAFAEREIVAFTAAIIMAWEIEPVAGKWVHPGRIPTAGTVVPKQDIKVRLWKREGW